MGQPLLLQQHRQQQPAIAGAAARDIRIDVRIKETNEITGVQVVPPQTPGGDTGGNSTEDNSQLRVRKVSSNVYHVTYTPTANDQSRWSGTRTTREKHRLLTVRYDIRHQLDAGEIQVKDGYFIHQFSPSGLQPIDKNIVFVIDASESMSGAKLTRVKAALIDILDELHSTDTFNIVSFGADIRYFNNESCVVATSDKIGNAKTFVSSLQAAGGANMNDALLRAVEFLVRQEEADPLATHVSMVMLVTDGRPTRGITDTTRILANVRQASGSRVCIFPVGLGLNVDFRFLDQLAQQNRGGAASRLLLSSETGDGVVVGSGADEPELAAGLKSFYRQIASPLLKNVRVRYDEVIDESGLTDVDFPAYFDGSEIVVAGQVKTGAPSRSSGGSQYTMVKVSGGSTKGYMSLDVRVKIPRATANSDSAGGRLASSGASTERMWAYLTVRRLLRKASGAANNSVIEATMASALQTASQYSFITPYSPVVLREVNQLGSAGSSEHSVFYTDMDAEIAENNDRKQVESGDGRLRKRPSLDKTDTQVARPGGSVQLRRPPAIVENDPHFLVSVDGLSSAVCFDVTGVPGTVYQLIHDRVTDIVVNALIVAKQTTEVVPPLSSPIQRKLPTYIGEISMLHGPCSVIISPSSVEVGNVIYRWPASSSNTTTVQCGDWMTIEIVGRRHVTVTMQTDVVVRVLRHGVSESHPFKVDFLGFYVERGTGLSEFTHGLVGQFTHQKAQRLRSSLDLQTADHDDSVRLVSRLSFSGPHSSHRTVRAVMTSRRDMQHKTGVPCWHVAHEGAGLIRGTPNSYIVSDLLDKRSSFHQNGSR